MNISFTRLYKEKYGGRAKNEKVERLGYFFWIVLLLLFLVYFSQTLPFVAAIRALS